MNKSVVLLFCTLFLAATASADKTCLKSTLRTNGKIRNTISTVAAPGACPRGSVEVLDTASIAQTITPTLAAGKTLRGVWGHFEDPTAATYQADTVSFGWELSAAPTTHYIAIGDTVPTGCSGTADAPGADPGHLCVFEVSIDNVGAKVIFDPTTGSNNAASTRGFGVYWTAAAGFTSLYGAWAVTAPLS
jgi:hypothetical protein